MSFPAIKRATLVAIALLLSLELAQARVAHSGTFQVNPIRITLSRQSSSSLLSVRNDSTEKIRFQIDVFAWDQNPKGEMVLNPTEDLTAGKGIRPVRSLQLPALCHCRFQ